MFNNNNNNNNNTSHVRWLLVARLVHILTIHIDCNKVTGFDWLAAKWIVYCSSWLDTLAVIYM